MPLYQKMLQNEIEIDEKEKEQKKNGNLRECTIKIFIMHLLL